MGYLFGTIGFALFFLSDYNDWRLARKELKFAFPMGMLLLVIGTAMDASSEAALLHGWLRIAGFVLMALFLALEIYTLFFALPAEASYARPGEERAVCTTGVYALCRHPGVLWFAGVYGCLWLTVGMPLWEAALYCGLDVLLVAFEDLCVFPARLEGYDAYRAQTPFLLPTRQSIRACHIKK